MFFKIVLKPVPGADSNRVAPPAAGLFADRFPGRQLNLHCKTFI